MSEKELQEDCAEILRKLMIRHPFLHPSSIHFDIWSSSDAVDAVADLVVLIKKSSAIEEAAEIKDWGK